MILVIGTVRIAAGAFDEAQPAMAKVIAATRAEDGCIQYAYARDVLDPELIHVSETWRDREALHAHFTTPHMLEWRASFGRLGISTRQLRVHEIGEGEPI
jgi:quinol monooxygenase YgiN